MNRDSSQQFDENDIDNVDPVLCSDVMREINQYLNDKNDTVALSKVDNAWNRALQDNVDQIWQEEWERFKVENQGQPWFTEKVYTIPFKESRFSSAFNAFRKLTNRDAKKHQSFRQRFSETVEVIENPSPIQLLIANGQAKVDHMNQHEFDQAMGNRPHVRLLLAKLGCITAAPILVALGTAMIPLSTLTSVGFLTYTKVTKQNYSGGGGPAGAGVVLLAMAFGPTALPWYCAYTALSFSVSERNLRRIPELYKAFGEYSKIKMENENLKPQSEEDLKIE